MLAPHTAGAVFQGTAQPAGRAPGESLARAGLRGQRGGQRHAARASGRVHSGEGERHSEQITGGGESERLRVHGYGCTNDGYAIRSV